MHIAVAGNIGAGKTTLTQMLGKHYGWETHFEDVEQNPYLNDFLILLFIISRNLICPSAFALVVEYAFTSPVFELITLNLLFGKGLITYGII